MHAWRGFASYRGGDARSWLSPIARNVFYSCMRHAHVRSEIQLDSDIDLADAGYLGSDGHVERLNFRNLLSRLPDELRTAFLLKHHMGLTYGEIGRRVDCAEATVRSRVHRALCMVRSAFAETRKSAVPVCSGMGMNRILDYVYDLLRPESMEAVEKHLRDCSSCRDLVGAARVLMRTVDAPAIDRRTMRLLDFDDRGVPGLYAALAKVVSEEDAPCDSISFTQPPECVRGVAIPGARLSCDMLPAHDHSD